MKKMIPATQALVGWCSKPRSGPSLLHQTIRAKEISANSSQSTRDAASIESTSESSICDVMSASPEDMVKDLLWLG